MYLKTTFLPTTKLSMFEIMGKTTDRLTFQK